ncbi:probable plastid-lipid-associated protein 14, chloroplastic [Rhododendron vialii]|uniref:probable plastid-lipid-associated protein 14, chloroplastic n=1 Tax=Rhododendron vialii TaxID=182163 RepID=UPI00265F5BA6|nr:probable plastid-lipid-associated protein 14, chloroplastic [Rhododendron vialii]XP_058206174.1 probable plastid-lipid-associated protein 14, chloroplastic [Rhododendron vialii]
MALCGIARCPNWDRAAIPIQSFNSSTRLVRLTFGPLMGKIGYSSRILRSRIRFSISSKNATPLDSEERASDTFSDSFEEELGHVMKFKMSDFEICDRVSIGLSGRADEVVFEAVVKDVDSPLHNSRVLLRRLTSAQAQRRGKRAIEVLKKLARRRLMYHSYSMQVHGYVDPSSTGDYGSFTLVHGYHGSFSLRHWLQQSDWLPTLEATLALDEDSVRRVGDDTVGGPAVSRQLRLTRILMRDLLIGVNYLHSHGLAHTELRLENVHVSPVDRHIKVGILGNAADFYDDNPSNNSMDANMDRRQMMIAFDMRCVGFMMAKMVLQELMEPFIFAKFKSFFTKGYDPSCLREYLLQSLGRNSSSGNAGLQILDRNWGAGWNLLSLLLASKPSERISCLDALRHPFLCGPRWRVEPSMDIIRWGLGSTAVRITEEYIYGPQQRSRLAHFIELMEMLNPHSKPKNWRGLLLGKWRLLYSTGRHIGLTLRQPPARVLIGDVHLTVKTTSKFCTTFSFTSEISFTVLIGHNWPHDKAGVAGKLGVDSCFRLTAGKRQYLKEEKETNFLPSSSNTADSIVKKLSGRRWRKAIPFKEFPSSLPVAKLVSNEIEVAMSLNDPLAKNVDAAKNAVHEVRTQVPPEMFDLSKLVCGTYVDSRLLVLRGVSGSALFFTRTCANEL